MSHQTWVTVPDHPSDDWDPPGYEPGPDDPGPVTHVHNHGEGERTLEVGPIARGDRA